MNIKECPSSEEIASAADIMFQIRGGIFKEGIVEAALRASQILISAGPTAVLQLCRDAGTYLSPAFWTVPEDLVAAEVLLSQSLRSGGFKELLLALNLGVPEGTIRDLAHELEDKFPGLDFQERYLLFGFAGTNLVRAINDGNWLNSQILNSKV